MTCIVGLVKKDKVIIGADSAGVAGLNITVRKDPKVFTVKDFVIGCTSSFRMIQLLRFSFSPPLRGGKEVYEYMCTDFINAVRDCFRSGGFMEKEKDAESGGCFLVGYQGRLFKIGSDYQVGESLNEYDAVGCGEEYAKGSLFSTQDTVLSARGRVSTALEAAEQFSGGVVGPMIIAER